MEKNVSDTRLELIGKTRRRARQRKY